MHRAIGIVLLVSLAGCRFDTSGLAVDTASAEGPPAVDSASGEQGTGDAQGAEAGLDTTPAPDLPAPDALTSDAPLPDAPPKPDTYLGLWYQADAKHCPTYCKGIGRTNVAGPEGAHCMSGENRPKSGVDAGITFTYGCPGSNCSPLTGPQQATTSSFMTTGYCYSPTQKKDWDATDKTVACFCL